MKQGDFIGYKAVRPSVLYRFSTCKDSSNPAVSACHIETAPAKKFNGYPRPSPRNKLAANRIRSAFLSWLFAWLGCNEIKPMPCQSVGSLFLDQFNLVPVSCFERPLAGSVHQFNVDRFPCVPRDIDAECLPFGLPDGFLQHFGAIDPNNQRPVSLRMIIN